MKLLKPILLTATALLGSVAAKAQCTVTVDNMTGEMGSTISMSVCLNNGDLSILGFQCDIEYPEGAVAGEPETTNRAPKHTIDTSDESKNPITYMLVSLKNLSFSGTSGALFTVPITLNMAPDQYKITINNIRCTLSDFTEVAVEAAEATLTVTGPSVPNEFIVTDEVKADDVLADNEIAKNDDGGWHARNLVLVDGYPYASEYDVQVATLTYQRTFPHTDWQAWYVPFSIGADKFASALTLVGSVTKDGVTNLVFQTVEDELAANTPYLVKPVEQTSTSLQGMTDVHLYAAPTPDGATVTDDFTLTGTYQGKNDMRTSNAYALSDGLFKRAKSDEVVLKPFRVYLTATAGGSAPAQLGVVLDDEVDAIESVRGTELLDCYDLQGRRVQLPAKGLYIVNGKKVLY